MLSRLLIQPIEKVMVYSRSSFHSAQHPPLPHNIKITYCTYFSVSFKLYLVKFSPEIVNLTQADQDTVIDSRGSTVSGEQRVTRGLCLRQRTDEMSGRRRPSVSRRRTHRNQAQFPLIVADCAALVRISATELPPTRRNFGTTFFLQKLWEVISRKDVEMFTLLVKIASNIMLVHFIDKTKLF